MERDALQPSAHPPQPVSVPLSILDAAVARYSATGGIWVFDRLPEAHRESPSEFLKHCRSAFVTTLDSFPQWAGQLHWAPAREGGGHTERFHRPMITWGADTDPGVEWTVARHGYRVADVVSPVDSRASGQGVWIGDAFPQDDFISNSRLPMQSLDEFQGLSAMHVQISLFAEGGYAVGVKMAHPLADAQALMVFMHQWAANSRALFAGTKPALASSPMGSPVFDPSLLDAAAAGDIDGPTPYPGLVAEARRLPRLRYDWWATDAPGYPPMMISNTQASKPEDAQLLTRALEYPAVPAPWDTWDLAAPVTFAVVHFSGQELTYLRDRARAGARPGFDISRLDAVLAHMWMLITTARFPSAASGHPPGRGEDEDEDQDVFLDVSLGARTRVSPPLPESFIGSPLFNASARMPVSALVSGGSSLGRTAEVIRSVSAHTFTPASVGAMLHEMAHQVAPQRIWSAFLGRLHVIVTSWLRLRLYELRFWGGESDGDEVEEGSRPVYVHAVLHKLDGCIQIMDSALDDGGMDLAVYLGEPAAKQVLRDEVLRPWYHDGSLARP